MFTLPSKFITWGMRDSLVSRVVVVQAWVPESESSAAMWNTRHSGVYLCSQHWGGPLGSRGSLVYTNQSSSRFSRESWITKKARWERFKKICTLTSGLHTSHAHMNEPVWCARTHSQSRHCIRLWISAPYLLSLCAEGSQEQPVEMGRFASFST